MIRHACRHGRRPGMRITQAPKGHTTMLNLLGQGVPFAATLGSIVAVVKQLAASALDGPRRHLPHRPENRSSRFRGLLRGGVQL